MNNAEKIAQAVKIAAKYRSRGKFADGGAENDGENDAGSPVESAINPAMIKSAMKSGLIVDPYSRKKSEAEQAKYILENTHTVPGGNVWKGQTYYSHKGPMGIEDVNPTVSNIPGVTPKTPVSMDWEQFYNQNKGGNMIAIGGDRSRLGRLTHINGKQLAWPVDLHAGTEYMLEPNKGAVWANAAGRATGYSNFIDELSKRGPVIGAFAPMGPKTGDSSVQMMDAILSQIAANPPDSAAIKQFDKDIKAGAYIAGQTNDAIEARKAEAARMKEFPGLKNIMEARNFLLDRNKVPGTTRSLIVKHLDKAGWYNAGFPHIGVTRVAITNPDLLKAPGNMIGHRVVSLQPGTVASTAFEHNTYPANVSGEYLGDVPLVPRHAALPDVVDKLLSNRYGANKDVLLHPYSTQAGGRSGFRKITEEQRIVQPINQRMLDSVMKNLELQKKYGFKKGGLVVGALAKIQKSGSDAAQKAVQIVRQFKRGRP